MPWALGSAPVVPAWLRPRLWVPGCGIRPLARLRFPPGDCLPLAADCGAPGAGPGGGWDAHPVAGPPQHARSSWTLPGVRLAGLEMRSRETPGASRARGARARCGAPDIKGVAAEPGPGPASAACGSLPEPRRTSRPSPWPRGAALASLGSRTAPAGDRPLGATPAGGRRGAQRRPAPGVASAPAPGRAPGGSLPRRGRARPVQARARGWGIVPLGGAGARSLLYNLTMKLFR